MASVTPGIPLRLDLARLDEPQEWHVTHLGLDYPGVVVVARSWRAEWGKPLEGDRYFRLVLLQEPPPAESPAPLEDPRIARCLPDGRVLEELARLGQQQRALRETQATYLASERRDLLRLTPALGAEQRELAQQVTQVYLRAWHQGSLETVGGRSGAGQVLQRRPDGMEALANRVAGWLLATSYSSLPWNTAALPQALASDDVAALYGAFTGQRGDAQTLAVVQAFGPALGLGPVGGPASALLDAPLLREVGQALQRGRGRLAAGQALHRLAHDQGWTHPAASLALLLYLFASPRELELTLVPGHPLTLRDGTPLAGDVLYRELLPELEWPRDLARWARVLKPVSPPTWRSALPWVRLFLPQAVEFLSQEEELEQRGLLVQRLRENAAGAREVMATLERLADLMRMRLPTELSPLQQLQRICQADNVEAFVGLARGELGGPLALQQALKVQQRASRLAQAAPQVRLAYTYLREAPELQGGRGLDLERLALLARLDLFDLLQAPSRWADLWGHFEAFQRRYSALYTQRHAARQREVASLRSRLVGVEPQAQALELLNTLEELGPPLGVGLLAQVRGLLADHQECPVGSATLGLQIHPFCPVCQWLPDQQTDAPRVEGLVHEVEEALRGQCRRLSAAAIQRILARSQEPLIDRFVQVVQSSDLAALASVLDPPLVDFLRRFLREA